MLTGIHMTKQILDVRSQEGVALRCFIYGLRLRGDRRRGRYLTRARIIWLVARCMHKADAERTWRTATGLQLRVFGTLRRILSVTC